MAEFSETISVTLALIGGIIVVIMIQYGLNSYLEIWREVQDYLEIWREAQDGFV